MLGPGSRVAKVEPAGAVQRLLWGSTGPAAGQQRVLVAVLAGEPDGEPPHGRGAGIAQPAQRQHLAAVELAVDVGEPAAEADLDLGKRGRAAAAAGRSWSIPGSWPPCRHHLPPRVGSAWPATGWPRRREVEVRMAGGGGRSRFQISLRASER